MGGDKKKEPIDIFADFDKILDDSMHQQEDERRQLLGDITQLPNPRPLHYHFSHSILPEYFSEARNLSMLHEFMNQGQEELFVKGLYHLTCEKYPDATCTFDVNEIHCSRHKIKSNWEDVEDFPLMVISMPRPQALSESFFACIALLPCLDFYHNQQWRYFVVDAKAANSGTSPTSILYEYIADPSACGKGLFLLMGSCWPEIDDLLSELEYKWDERFYTL